MNRFYFRVAARCRNRCEYCHAPGLISNCHFDVDHIVPESSGGPTLVDNLALACSSCNSSKSDRQTGRDPETGREERLFHPRIDDWDEHFSVDFDAGTILGKTPVGRATVNLLRMNAENPVRARRIWIEKKLFPEND